MEMKAKMRRPYQNPQIHEVKLDLEESVLAACKVTSLVTNPAGIGNLKCNHRQGCLQTLGS